MTDRPLEILAFGAHPDDCDHKAGGTAAKFVEAGHDVRFVSVTDGGAGHHEIGGVELVRRRREEARSAASVVGIEYDVMSNPDGRLQPTLSNREDLIRTIRTHEPDVVLTHRPNDYHPDHRYASKLVQDSAYMITVPNVCPDTEALDYEPAIYYVSDDFRKPAPFEPDVVVAIDDVVDDKLEMLHRHESQVYEWLPYNDGVLDAVPEAESDRREWLRDRWLPRYEAIADRFREHLIDRYGETRGKDVRYAEAFERCEYGGPPPGTDGDPFPR